MSINSKTFLSWKSQIVYILTIPFFFMVFTALYRPERAEVFLDMGKGMFSFNLTIISCILLGVMIISRALQLSLKKVIGLGYRLIAFWQLAEVVLMALFSALYMTLMYQGQYSFFHVAGVCMLIIGLTVIYPYAIIGASLRVKAEKEKAEDVQDDSLLRFSDATNKLKMVVAASTILYIEAKENYVIIKYMNGDKPKEYTLRSSMVALEETVKKHGLVRCQRSYYINPTHVKVLRKDKEGTITAELNQTGVKSIPVSPKYYEDLAGKL